MSESTSTTTTTTTKKTPAKKATTAPPSSSKDKWRFAGYWNALIGAFILIVQGFLLFFNGLAGGIGFLAGSNIFVTFGSNWGIWLAAALQMALGIFILILIWETIQKLLNIGVLVKDTMWLGIILLLIGIITLGLGGALVLVGGIFYLLSIPK